MKRKIIAALLALCMIISVVAGCTSNPTKTETSTKTTTVTTTTQNTPKSYNFTDSAGRTVEIPSEINSIIPSGPVAQMMLIAIAPEKISALATKLSDSMRGYIPDYLFDLPYVGQLYGSADLNRETLASIGCDLIIDLGEPKATIVEDMNDLTNKTGIPAIHITASFNRGGEAYRTLGKVLGCEAKANEIGAYCDTVATNMSNVMRSLGNNKVRAAYVVYNGDNSVNVIAKSSYQAEVFDSLFDNVAVVNNPTGKGTGNTVDLEQLLLWDPDVLIFAWGDGYEAVASGEANPVWYELKAIKNGTYYEMPGVPYNWFANPPSVNRYIGAVWYSVLFYNGEANVTYDMRTEANKYYKLFYGCDLTDAQYNDLMANSVAKIK